MKLKGKSVIELTNIKTGKKEIYENKNIVTNSIKNMFGINLSALVSSSRLRSIFMPLYRNALGGVLAFDNTIAEDPDILFAPPNVNYVAYAGNNINTTTDKRRGSLNADECEATDNQIKLVWDFSTSQGNGTIKCLSLTSGFGGRVGDGGNAIIGDGYYNSSSWNPPCYYESERFIRISDNIQLPGWVEPLGIYKVDFETGDIYYSTLWEKKLTLNKVHHDFFKFGLNQGCNNWKTVSSSSVTLNLFKNYNKNYYGDNYNRYLSAFDGNKYVYYFYAGNNYYYSNDAWNNPCTEVIGMRVNIYDPTDFSEFTWTFSGFSVRSVNYNRQYNVVILNNKVYFWAFSPANNIVAIPIVVEDKTFTVDDVSFLTKSADSITNLATYGNEPLRSTSSFVLNGVGYLNNAVFRDGDTEYKTMNKINGRNYSFIGFPQMYKNFLLSFYLSGNYGCMELYVPTNYLATINNLETPIEKTAEKTMKITYTLTQTE